MPLHSAQYCSAWVGHWCLQVHPPPHSWAWARTHLSTRRPLTRLGFISSSPEDGEAQFRFVVCVSSFLDFNLFAFLSSRIGVLDMCSYFCYLPLCVEFKMRAPFMSLIRICLQRFQQRSSSLPMLLNLPIFWRKHRPHLLVAPALSTN
jgi:hypothetical protein